MKAKCTGKLNHLSLPTTNPIATAAFFEKHFACEVVAVGESILLKRDGFDIVLDGVSDATPWPHDFHFGFEMATVQQVRELYEAFKEDGVHMETEVFNNSRGSRFFCRTPEGLMIEVTTREDKSDTWRQLF
jgi:catechol 2,3-dioxygenase-like lactoylglutathione lyase family enzyme